MGLFRKKKKEVIENRTDLEIQFEEKGQKIGKETGEFVQKSIDKINEFREKYETDEKVEKVKEFAGKAERKVKEKATQIKDKIDFDEKVESFNRLKRF